MKSITSTLSLAILVVLGFGFGGLGLVGCEYYKGDNLAAPPPSVINPDVVKTNTAIEGDPVVPLPCVPEDNATFCTRLAVNCGVVTAVDTCGTPKSANCGATCTAPETCGGGGMDNVCGGSVDLPTPPTDCVPDSDTIYCGATRNCGPFSGPPDNCGNASRTANCGSCSDPTPTCGGPTATGAPGTSNVCGVRPRLDLTSDLGLGLLARPVTPNPLLRSLPGIDAPLATRCVPPTYPESDGRIAVPLVITAYRNVTSGGDMARFVKSTDKVAMAFGRVPGPTTTMTDGISSLTIQRGPNYVVGDKVTFKGHSSIFTTDLVPIGNAEALAGLGPNSYPNLTLQDLNEKIVALEIVRSPDLATKTCADGPGTDPDAWSTPTHPKSIHLIAEIQAGGESEQIIENPGALSAWGLSTGNLGAGFVTPINKITLRKGPDYQGGPVCTVDETAAPTPLPIPTGDNIRLYENPTEAASRFATLSECDHHEITTPEWSYTSYRTGEMSSRVTNRDGRPTDLMTTISSISFRNASGEPIP